MSNSENYSQVGVRVLGNGGADDAWQMWTMV